MNSQATTISSGKRRLMPRYKKEVEQAVSEKYTEKSDFRISQ